MGLSLGGFATRGQRAIRSARNPTKLSRMKTLSSGETLRQPLKPRSVSELRNTERGTCYILGNSSSLNAITLSPLTEKFPTIGINRILRVVETRWLIISDLDVLAVERARLFTASKTRLLLCGAHYSAALKLGLLPSGDRTYLWHTHHNPYQEMPTGLPTPRRDSVLFSGNSGTYGMELAALMGFNEIRLLGIDLRYDLQNSHFFGDGKKEGCALGPKALPAYRSVFRELQRRGVRVVNESPYEGPLDEFLPREKSAWLRNSATAK